MPRTIALALAVLALLWQGLAGASMQGWAAVAADARHAALHWHDVAHHHHDDGSYTEDDSVDSVLHVALDGGLQAALVVAMPALSVAVATHVAPAYRQSRLPAPVLDPFQRPPRMSA